MKIAKTISIVLLFACSTSAPADDWLGFRGTHGNSVAVGSLPAQCDDEQIAWSAELPGRGVSSPIVVGDQVVVTASSGFKQDRLHVLSFDVATGKPRWHRQFWATGRTLTHPTSANAAPTPASDGQRIVAFYSSNDTVCLDLEGGLLWYRGLGFDYPKAGNDIGMSSSPLIAEEIVVCQVECQGDSFVEGIDASDGTSAWRIGRPADSNWSSPIYLADEKLVVLKSDESVSAHHIVSGQLRWEIEGEVGGIPSIVHLGKKLYVPGDTFTVLELTSRGAVLDWDSNRLNSGNASPVIVGDKLYLLSSGGVLTRFDLESGEKLGQLRIGGSYWATPVVSGGRLYAVNQSGDLSIVELGDEMQTVDEHKFGEAILGSPAAAGNALFLRSDGHLWKVAAPQ